MPNFPQSFDNLQKASTAPGIVTAWGEFKGIDVSPWALRLSALAELGAIPDPFIDLISLEPAGEKSTKQSPPIPVICGSHIPRRTAPAIAASIAFPPFFKISNAAWAAKGWEVAHIPFSANTEDRPGKWKSRMLTPIHNFLWISLILYKATISLKRSLF